MFFTLSIFLITPVTPVSDIQCLAGCDGFKQRREEFHSLQALVLVKPNYWLRTSADSCLEMSVHFFHPGKTWHTFKTLKHGNGLGKLCDFVFSKR